MLGASRSVKWQLQGKAASSTACGPRLSARHARRVSRSFTDRRRALVTVAAAAAPAPQQQAAPAPKRALSSIRPNEIVEGRVVSIQPFGAFVDIGADAQGLVHVSQLTDGFVRNVADVIKMGEVVKVKVLSVDVEGRRLALTRKGLAPRPATAAGPADDEDALAADDAEASDPNSTEVDGLSFVVVDADEEGGPEEELDPAEVEFVTDIPAEVTREIAIACEDLVNGTVTAVDDNSVTVSYTLSDGTPVQGVIAKAELLAPAYLVAAGDDSPDEAEEYVEVDDISPAQYYKVGDTISCAVFDVEEGAVPLLTQRLPEDADDELAELVEQMDQIEDIDSISDALLIQGLWAADEVLDDDEEGPMDNADVTLEQVAPLEAVSAVAEEGDLAVSTAPDDLRYEVFAKRAVAAPASNTNLLSTVGLNLPSRALNISPSAQVTGALLDEYGNAQVDLDDVDEDELIGVSVNNTSFIPRRLLKKIGYKIVKDEESGEWEAVEREGADQIEISDELAAEMEALAAGTAVDQRDIDAIVKDLLAADEDLEEAEVPLFARRNPVVAAAAVSAGISAAEVKALRQKTGAGMMDCKKALAECSGDADKAVEWLRQKGLSGADKKAGRVAAEGGIVRYIHPGSRLGVLLEVNCETDFVAAGDVFNGLANELAMVVASSDVVCVSVDDMPGDLLAKEREVEMGKEDLKSKPEAVRAKIVEGRLDKIKKQYALLEQPALRDNNKTVGELIKETIAATGENIQVRRFVRFNLGEGLEKKSNDFAAEVAQQTQKKEAAPAAAPAAKEQPKQPEPAAAAKPAVQVSAGQVKQLRDKSGAGMMDCKKALAECNGDLEAASEWLRKKGLASADKKSGRLAAEGGLVSYIHPGSRLGVLLEVNCETDFVAAGDVFNTLANTLAMQIAASTVEYVAADEIPAEVFEKEKEIEMGREDLQSKPEAIRAKIAEGRVKKLVQERVLLEQPYLLDPNKTVAEAVKEAISQCGENVQVRRFVRYNLGEGIEKKESNLAAEVAAATGKA